MKKPSFWAIALTSLFFLSGCKSPHEASDSSQPARLTYALFDVSSSTKNMRTRYYHDYVNIVVDKSDGNEIFKGDWVTANSQASSRSPVDFTLSARTWTTNPYKFKKDQLKVKNQAYSAIYQPPADKVKRTDLMNSLQLAENAFSGSSATSKRLIIFSDMIEQSGRYDFTSEWLSNKRISEIIKAEDRDSRLPNLKGVEVWVDGAGANVKPLAPGQLRGIRKFWIEYFQAAGADLKKYRYSSTLTNYQN